MAFQKIGCSHTRKGDVPASRLSARKEVRRCNLIAWSFKSNAPFKVSASGALRNEAANAHKEIKRRRAKEVSFSDLTPQEQDQLCTYDSYFYGGHEDTEPGYYAAGKKITAKLIAEALRTLPEEKRKAVLLYYFAGMTDTEIGKLFDAPRSTIQYRRTSSFELLKKYLEEHADEWDEW